MIKIRVDDLGKIVTGKTPRTSIPENYGGNVLFLTPTDDLSPMKCRTTLSTISELGLKEVRNCIIPKDSICVSCIGSDMGHAIMTTKPTVTNQQFNSIIPSKDYHSEYVYYLMVLLGRMMKSKFGKSSTAVPIVSKSLFSSFEIYIEDDKRKQKVIADVLANIDEKIALNTRMNAELEAMAKQLYDYWFVQFDFPDENGKPYKSSGGKMVYNPTLKREIPAGWEVTSIGDLITTERGISYSTPNISSGNGVPMLNLATFMPGGGDYKASGLKHYLGDYPPSKVLKPYDLIMCNTQQTAIKFETDIIGRAMLVPDIFEGDIVFSHHVNIIKTKNDDLKYYLLYLFNSDYYHKYISGYTNGTNILGLSFNGVSEYNLEIPPDAILKQFASLILDIAKKKSLIFKESSNLTHLRDSLLPMLMNGQVTVE